MLLFVRLFIYVFQNTIQRSSSCFVFHNFQMKCDSEVCSGEHQNTLFHLLCDAVKRIKEESITGATGLSQNPIQESLHEHEQCTERWKKRVVYHRSGITSHEASAF
jgi:hypothetical protein